MSDAGGETYNTLKLERPQAGILQIVLNRPKRLNAISFEMFEELPLAVAEAAADDQVRVVVLTGAGRGFCAGLDLDDVAALTEMSSVEMLARQEGWANAIAAFRFLPKPVIAAVNGAAAGAGFALALAADVRLAAPAAKFNAAFVKVGLSGGDVGVSWSLPRIVGLGRASEIMLTGRLFDADWAERIGLVNQVVEGERLLDAAYALAAEMIANSPFGIRLTKQVLQVNVDAPSLATALELENRNQTLTAGTADMAEALAAFRERRPPRFEGR